MPCLLLVINICAVFGDTIIISIKLIVTRFHDFLRSGQVSDDLHGICVHSYTGYSYVRAVRYFDKYHPTVCLTKTLWTLGHPEEFPGRKISSFMPEIVGGLATARSIHLLNVIPVQ